jgi:hypothetical protein
MFQNKSIDGKKKREETRRIKSRNRKDKEPHRRWRKRIGGEEKLEPEEMIETDAAKGKEVLGNGITWNKKIVWSSKGPWASHH